MSDGNRVTLSMGLSYGSIAVENGENAGMYQACYEFEDTALIVIKDVLFANKADAEQYALDEGKKVAQERLMSTLSHYIGTMNV